MSRLEGGGISVRFSFEQDRFAHEIWLATDSGEAVYLSSLEGAASDSWPASPPLQTLSLSQSESGNPLALLVGMAGKSHWSASIELDRPSACLSFDIACRVRAGEAGSLGSSYRVETGATRFDGDRMWLGNEPASRCPWTIAVWRGRGPARLESNGRVLSISATAADQGETARTIRWGYQLRRAAN